MDQGQFHFFEHDDKTFAYKVFNDVVRVYPVKDDGTFYTKKYIEACTNDKVTLVKAAITLIENPILKENV